MPLHTCLTDADGTVTSSSPLTYWGHGVLISGNTSVVAANVVRLTHFFLPAAVAFNTIGISNIAADAVNSYSFGVYSLSGATLYAHSTAQAMVGSSTFRALANAEGMVTLTPGDYLFAWTGAATTATFLTFGNTSSRLIPSSSSTTTASGVMPSAPINVPALSATLSAASIPAFILYQ